MPLIPQIPKPQVVKPKISEEVAETEDVQVSEEESRRGSRTLPKTIREYMIFNEKIKRQKFIFLQIK